MVSVSGTRYATRGIGDPGYPVQSIIFILRLIPQGIRHARQAVQLVILELADISFRIPRRRKIRGSVIGKSPRAPHRVGQT